MNIYMKLAGLALWRKRQAAQRQAKRQRGDE